MSDEDDLLKAITVTTAAGTCGKRALRKQSVLRTFPQYSAQKLIGEKMKPIQKEQCQARGTYVVRFCILASLLLIPHSAWAAEKDIILEICNVTNAGTSSSVRVEGCIDGHWFGKWFASPDKNEYMVSQPTQWDTYDCGGTWIHVENFSDDGVCIDTVGIVHDGKTLKYTRFVDACGLVDNEGAQTASEVWNANHESYGFWIDANGSPNTTSVTLIPPSAVIFEWHDDRFNSDVYGTSMSVEGMVIVVDHSDICVAGIN